MDDPEAPDEIRKFMGELYTDIVLGLARTGQLEKMLELLIKEYGNEK